MKFLTTSAAVCAAAFISITAGVPMSASAQAAFVAAPESDYSRFLKLADGLRLTEYLEATTIAYARQAPEIKDRSARWHATFRTAITRGMNARRDAIADAYMRPAFTSFSHDDVERLTVIIAGPFPVRYHAARIKALLDGQDMDAFRASVTNDPDLLAMPDYDRELLGRLWETSTTRNPVVERVTGPIIEKAFNDAEAQSARRH